MGSLRKGVGARIRMLRKSAGLTLETAASRIAMDAVYLGRVERGEINVSLDTLQRIATALKVEPIELLSSDESRHREEQETLKTLLTRMSPASRKQLITLAKHLSKSRE